MTSASKESKIQNVEQFFFLLSSRTDIVAKEVLLLPVSPKNRCSETLTISKEQLI